MSYDDGSDATGDLVLLYDGECGFCDGAVQFLLARDRKQRFRFAPLQGAFAARLLAARPDLRSVDSVMLVRTAHSGHPDVLVRSKAVLAVADALGGFWRALALPLRWMPRQAADGLYDAFARRRTQFFGRRDACRIPSAEQRARFLD
ncbi:MAG: thiol-disulfide oxidoreductase DCC family protein [Gemmatimonas sp.]